MSVAQMMTLTLFGRWRDNWSCWLRTAIVVASLQACFLQSNARENGDPN
jgi:hypothetical protein